MLTPRQQRFVEEYRVDGEADGGKGAAIRAGYAARTAALHAQQNLARPEVRAAIVGAAGMAGLAGLAEEATVPPPLPSPPAPLKEEAKNRSGICADYVVQSLMDTLERCLQAKPVLDRAGKPVLVETPEGVMAAAYTFDAQHALKASELLGKHLGLFADKTDKKDGKEGREQAATPVINLTLNKTFDP
jgi:phage terminase small subunit